MFQFSGFAPLARWYTFSIPGCPIRTSADQFLFADPRSFSQLITSFFASESLGIPHTLFLTSFLRCFVCITTTKLTLCARFIVGYKLLYIPTTLYYSFTNMSMNSLTVLVLLSYSERLVPADHKTSINVIISQWSIRQCDDCYCYYLISIFQYLNNLVWLFIPY